MAGVVYNGTHRKKNQPRQPRAWRFESSISRDRRDVYIENNMKIDKILNGWMKCFMGVAVRYTLTRYIHANNHPSPSSSRQYEGLDIYLFFSYSLGRRRRRLGTSKRQHISRRVWNVVVACRRLRAAAGLLRRVLWSIIEIYTARVIKRRRYDWAMERG